MTLAWPMAEYQEGGHWLAAHVWHALNVDSEHTYLSLAAGLCVKRTNLMGCLVEHTAGHEQPDLKCYHNPSGSPEAILSAGMPCII